MKFNAGWPALQRLELHDARELLGSTHALPLAPLASQRVAPAQQDHLRRYVDCNFGDKIWVVESTERGEPFVRTVGTTEQPKDVVVLHGISLHIVYAGTPFVNFKAERLGSYDSAKKSLIQDLQASTVVSHGSLSMTRGCVWRFFHVLALVLAACTRAAHQSTAPRVPAASSAESPIAKPTTDSTREYTGEWETGFETSVFRGCNGSTPAKVWVRLAPGASESARWSDNTGAAANTRTYYVRVRGILRGPASHRKIGDGYGHLGGSDYELYVTRVLEVEPPGEPNCLIRR